ncbi:hypothetical protein VNO77_27373 [Canavalia gladiata]|uniref:Uncharacterized protein n=1 Tax=Canavalia gladiata TaxID=3824 RepID=A0AAN9KU10_CANGL
MDMKEGLGIISGVDEKRAFGYEIVGFQVVPYSIERGAAAMAKHNKTLISRSALALFKLNVNVLSHGLKKQILENLPLHGLERYRIYPQLVQFRGDDPGVVSSPKFTLNGTVPVTIAIQILSHIELRVWGHFEWPEVIACLKSPVPINVGSSLSSVEATTNLNTRASVILVARLFKDKFKHLSALLLAIYLVISADANFEYRNH